ncbi:hypothetical protein AAC387_Pa07g2796 [Persea americana]
MVMAKSQKKSSAGHLRTWEFIYPIRLLGRRSRRLTRKEGEFRMLYEMIMDEEEDMREPFNAFDENGDGFISVEELRSVLGSFIFGVIAKEDSGRLWKIAGR